jgi:hypothetical protein
MFFTKNNIESSVFVQKRSDPLAYYGSLTTFGHIMVHSTFPA